MDKKSRRQRRIWFLLWNLTQCLPSQTKHILSRAAARRGAASLLGARRLRVPATVMKCVTPAGANTPWVFVGCEDGTVQVLDGDGEIIRGGAIEGRPTHIETMVTADGPIVLLATAKGRVEGFEVAD